MLGITLGTCEGLLLGAAESPEGRVEADGAELGNCDEVKVGVALGLCEESLVGCWLTDCEGAVGNGEGSALGLPVGIAVEGLSVGLSVAGGFVFGFGFLRFLPRFPLPRLFPFRFPLLLLFPRLPRFPLPLSLLVPLLLPLLRFPFPGLLLNLFPRLPPFMLPLSLLVSLLLLLLLPPIPLSGRPVLSNADPWSLSLFPSFGISNLSRSDSLSLVRGSETSKIGFRSVALSGSTTPDPFVSVVDASNISPLFVDSVTSSILACPPPAPSLLYPS